MSYGRLRLLVLLACTALLVLALWSLRVPGVL